MNLVKEKKGLSIAALVLGLVGLLAWILPIIGLPVGVVGLVLGIVGIKKGARKRAVAGIVLSIISLLLTIANASIGAYMGYKGQLFFQQENIFSLRDEDGNILLEGGVQEAGIVTADSYKDAVELSDLLNSTKR